MRVCEVVFTGFVHTVNSADAPLCNGVVPECRGVTQNGSETRDTFGDDQRIRVWRHRGQHQDGMLSCVTCLEDLVLHGMDYHRTPLGTSTPPCRDVCHVALASLPAPTRVAACSSSSVRIVCFSSFLPLFICLFASTHVGCVSYLYPKDIFIVNMRDSAEYRVYSREQLLALRPMGRVGVVQTIPAELRRKYRGCRAGAKLKAKKTEKRWRYKPSVPSVVMGNVNSLTNKTDELACLVKNQRLYRECSLFCFTETWLTPDTPDANVELPGFSTVRAERDQTLSGKRKGGGAHTFHQHQMVQPWTCKREGGDLLSGH
ncbi:hypothetical protein NFI96_003954 [Prochilodus magdalenae]|nr:hypothetical protein NFI96_003954 [Prochilodus magdalenae]